MFSKQVAPSCLKLASRWFKMQCLYNTDFGMWFLHFKTPIYCKDAPWPLATKPWSTILILFSVAVPICIFANFISLTFYIVRQSSVVGKPCPNQTQRIIHCTKANFLGNFQRLPMISLKLWLRLISPQLHLFGGIMPEEVGMCMYKTINDTVNAGKAMVVILMRHLNAYWGMLGGNIFLTMACLRAIVPLLAFFSVQIRNIDLLKEIACQWLAWVWGRCCSYAFDQNLYILDKDSTFDCQNIDLAKYWTK